MKRILAVSLVLSLLTIGSVAFANSDKRGGYTGPSSALTTVEEAKRMRDDTDVTLQGVIEKHVGGEYYLFTDSTGSIQIEIDDKKWRGQNIGPNDKVEIRGEIEADWYKRDVTIDVDSLQKI